DYCSFFDCNPGDFITVNGQTSSGIAENTITTSSLTISTGFLGDGGPATSALLQSPADMAVGGDGNIYIADTGSNRIRMVDVAGKFGTPGNIYTVAVGFNRPNGVALDNDDNIYVADTLNNRIQKIDAATGAVSTVAGNGCLGQNCS